MSSSSLDNPNQPKRESDSRNSSESSANQPDDYWENGYLVFTEHYLSKRGWCCGNGCRHCPYEPKHETGNINLKATND